MKKIDLHIHTIPTIHDAAFTFDINTLTRYVSEAGLDAIAVTNHNVFDTAQFATIQDALDPLGVVPFPGIEVTLDCGHVLIISDSSNIAEFAEQAEQLEVRINHQEDSITTAELVSIFSNLSDFIIIPHFLKKPAITGENLDWITEYTSSGEVDSAKKFIRTLKDDTQFVPLLFSDVRISDTLKTLPTRQTFVDCGKISFSALKTCLQDKSKVFLSQKDGNSLFQIFPNGQMMSTGLNVLLGERSSGKTHTLDLIDASYENVKYIRQFSLVQQNDEAYERDFNNELQRTRSQFIDEYLSGFKKVLHDVTTIDLRADERALDKYLRTLTESAAEADRKDSFSNTALFDESEFPTSKDQVLRDLISSVRQLIENVEYSELIEKHVDRDSLKLLAVELIELLRAKALERKKKKFVNSLVREIKGILDMRTSAVQIQDVDLYQLCINQKKVDKFSEIVKNMQVEATISEEHIQGFQVVATKSPYKGAGEIKTASGKKTAFREAFDEYERPYDYLQALLANETLAQSDLYKLFVKIGYKILNKDGYEVSGGERSEFRLLQEIKDAQNYDMLLVDEPESSFDNIFLRSDVNQILREVSETMPVVVVTHNSTVGASIQPNYTIYASKDTDEGGVVYRLYSGYPTDIELQSQDGKKISNHRITMNSLEAGSETYENRRERYEAIKN